MTRADELQTVAQHSASPDPRRSFALRSYSAADVPRRYGAARANDKRRADPFQGNGPLIERACKRLAAAHGYGQNFNTSTALPATQRESADGPRLRPDSYAVASLGGVVEQAARAVHGSSSARRVRNWSYSAGVALVPALVPDPSAQLAMSDAGLSKPLRHLLLTFALEDISAWYKVEACVLGPTADPLRTMAWRDAMARLMYFRAATPVDERAKQLRLRAATYREATEAAQLQLVDWLAQAARAYLAVPRFKPEPIGYSQGNGLRSASWWREGERLNIRDGRVPSQRPK